MVNSPPVGSTTCEKLCEAVAYQIALRNRDSEIDRLHAEIKQWKRRWEHATECSFPDELRHRCPQCCEADPTILEGGGHE